jgi:hypothetical protein
VDQWDHSQAGAGHHGSEHPQHELKEQKILGPFFMEDFLRYFVGCLCHGEQKSLEYRYVI